MPEPSVSKLLPRSLLDLLASMESDSDRIAVRPGLQRFWNRVEDADRPLVERALLRAAGFHSKQRRANGDPYITHPIAVATILAEQHLDGPTIAAALLHDTLEDTEYSALNLAKEFEEPIPALVQGVTKLQKINFTRREHQSENLRRLFLAAAKDIRVVLIKVADRLHNMRTLEHLKPEKRVDISRETMAVFAPLAHRLGMMKVRSELEDLCMRWLYPEEYSEIESRFLLHREEREQLVEETKEYLKMTLALDGHPDVEIEGRSKHFFSVWQKMTRDGAPFEEVYDLNAVRIICARDEECYDILRHIHTIWNPLPGRLKDYIAAPKPNGYRSLHTTVRGIKGATTEIQIRTKEMHRIAEEGVAAHWAYKERPKRTQQGNDPLAHFRTLMEWIGDLQRPNDFMDALEKDVFAEVVVCLTPESEPIELPAGSTPVDFAYAIHTRIGDTCIGAKVNRIIVPLDTKLKMYDQIEILTRKDGTPSAKWLEFVRTGRAKQKIKHWLKEKEADRWIGEGRKRLAGAMRQRRFEVTQEELKKALEGVLKVFRVGTLDDLLMEVGIKAIPANKVLNEAFAELRTAGRNAKKTARDKELLRQKSLGAVGLPGLGGVGGAGGAGSVPAAPVAVNGAGADATAGAGAGLVNGAGKAGAGVGGMNGHGAVAGGASVGTAAEAGLGGEAIGADECLSATKVTPEEILLEGNLQGIHMKVANCCSPKLPDPIIGFTTRGRGVTIHKLTCPGIERIRAKGERFRLVQARWGYEAMVPCTEVTVRVTAEDRSGLFRDVGAWATQAGFFITGGRTVSHEQKNVAEFVLRVKVGAVRPISVLQEWLRGEPHVLSVDVVEDSAMLEEQER